MPTRQKIDGKELELGADAVRYGFASVRLEGLEAGSEAEAIASRFVDGELTHEEYHAARRRLARDIARKGH